MTLKSLPLVLIALMALIASPALAKTSTADFVKKAAIANKFEIDSSQLALKQSQDDGVKAFAQQMIDDHTKAGDAFGDALKSAKTPMTPPTDLDKSHQKDMDKLGKLQAASFDKQYIKMQVSAHKDAVKLFTDYSKKGDDASLKNFATTTLPTLQQHLDSVNKLQKDYGKKQASAK
jgi:putative membrane protein